MKATGLVIVIFAGTCLQAQHLVTVGVQGGNVINTQLLARSEGLANNMFKEAGIRIGWQTGSDRQDAISLKVCEKTPGNYHPGALAIAQLDEDVHITVFYDRIVKLYAPDLRPALLAHVFVHEITHVLQGVNVHSNTGIMKAYWSEQDLAQMPARSLVFTMEDVNLIRRGPVVAHSSVKLLVARKGAVSIPQVIDQ